MFDKKIILYFALAIIGFLLWNAWEKDYGTKPLVTSPVTAQPQGGMLPSQQLPKEAPEAVTSGVIQVKTDVFNITIDKKGGNIISLSLPKYPKAYETPHIPEQLLTDNLANYYIAQSGVMSKTGLNTAKVVFSSPKTSYELQPGQDLLTVTLTWHGEGIEITKTYQFKRSRYDIHLNYDIKNHAATAWVGNIFAKIKRRGLGEEGGTLGLHTYRGAAISSPETPYEKISYQKMNKQNLDRTIKGGWAAMQQRYFVSAWVPNQNYTLHYFSDVESVGATEKDYDRIYTIGFMYPEITIPPNGNFTTSLTFYSGPAIADYLKAIAPHLDLVIDYGWLSIFSVPIFKVMQWIYFFVRNWGVAIILITVLIKLLFYKLSETSYRSMAKMRNLQPRLLALKERYGDDRHKLSQATMELYRQEKVNPLGGCLPMIVQIPVFIALYYVLIESVELRQAPFVFWIHDLSVKDPYYVLPILMGISWMFQQKLNPPPPDPVQAKMMMMFPIVFTILFAAFPAGLVLYWLVNNCLSILQQWHIMRKFEKQEMKKKKSKKK